MTESAGSDESRVQELFDAVLAISDLGQLQKFLEENCDDPTLRREVESLWAAYRNCSSSFLETPAFKLGRYTILRSLAVGGMGIVFEAQDPELGNRPVALKVLKAEHASGQPFVARFNREITTLAKLKHDNLVAVYDKGEMRGCLFFVMELVDGADLFQLVSHLSRAERCLPINDACEIARQVAIVLQFAHDRNYIHRDIKPHNIMLTAEGKVKLLDLGLVGFLHPEAPPEQLTATVAVMGTPDYIAPEQCISPNSTDTHTDIYSLGCTLYHLLCGTPPFGGITTAAEKIAAHLSQEVPSIRAIRQDVCVELEASICRMLAKDPVDRHQTATEVAESLAPFCSGYDLSKHGNDVHQVLEATKRESMPEADAFLDVLGMPPDGLAAGGQGSPTIASSPLESGNTFQEPLLINVPGPPTEFFTGRAEEIATCRDLFKSNCRVALFGDSGVGKTEIALAYAHKHQGEYKYVIWANAESTECLSRNFTKIASSLKLSLGKKKQVEQTPAVAAVKRWLERNGHWLLVLDNADKLEIVQPFLPEKPKGHVLLATEAKTPSGLAAPIRIFPLPPKEGALLVLRRAGLIRPDQELKDVATKDRKAALDISEEMEGDPLALDIAGAFIAQVKLELSSYLKNYRQQREIERGDDDWQTILQTTCGLTYHEVTQANRAAGDLFRLFSLMALEEIPEDVLLAAGRLATGVHGEQLRGPSEFDAAIEILSNFSLLRRRPYTNTISMHRLVRDARELGLVVAQEETRLVCDALAVLEALDWMPHDGRSLHSSAGSTPPIFQVVDCKGDAGCGIWRGIERLVSVPSSEFALLRKICIARYGCFGATPALFFYNWFDIELTEWLESLPGDCALRYKLQGYFSWLAETRLPEQEVAKQRDRDALFPPREQPGRLQRVGPDDACPCGSGKKFKECCGDKPSPDDTKVM